MQQTTNKKAFKQKNNTTTKNKLKKQTKRKAQNIKNNKNK